jgi:hypothetical protein
MHGRAPPRGRASKCGRGRRRTTRHAVAAARHAAAARPADTLRLCHDACACAAVTRTSLRGDAGRRGRAGDLFARRGRHLLPDQAMEGGPAREGPVTRRRPAPPAKARRARDTHKRGARPRSDTCVSGAPNRVTSAGDQRGPSRGPSRVASAGPTRCIVSAGPARPMDSRKGPVHGQLLRTGGPARNGQGLAAVAHCSARRNVREPGLATRSDSDVLK